MEVMLVINIEKKKLEENAWIANSGSSLGSELEVILIFFFVCFCIIQRMNVILKLKRNRK